MTVVPQKDHTGLIEASTHDISLQVKITSTGLEVIPLGLCIAEHLLLSV